MVVPIPATWAPDRVIASICQAADPLRPPAWYGFQLPPVEDAHRATAGWLLCEPTETNPCAPAATASTWLEPSASFTSCARVQLVMLADHQTSATQLPPAATSLPTMTYPAGPEVAATAETPARSWVMFPPATPQISPSAEVSTTGPGAPTASHPAGPCVTLVSARR